MSVQDNDPKRLHAKFLELQLAYSARNGVLDELDSFFAGIQWEDPDPDDEEELVRVTLNYTQLAALDQMAYLSGAPVRADVYQGSGDSAARKRETFLRSMLTYKSLWGAWVMNVEHDANVASYAVVQAIWAPPKGSVKRAAAPDALGTPQTRYTKPPFKFRAVPPSEFYPVFRSFDEPDDFLYVFRYQEERLIEDLEMTYGVELQATETQSGTKGTCEVLEYWTDEEYIFMAITKRRSPRGIESSPVILKREKHGYPRIPFFIVQNLRVPHKDPVLDGSISTVQLLQPINKHLNLVWTMTATEILTRMRPPTVYKSDMPELMTSDIRMGAGEVIPIKTDEEIEPLSWSGIPATVTKHADDTMKAFADLGSMPRTDLSGGGSAPSGVGMRLAYANLELILSLKIPLRVAALESVLSFCLEVLEKKLGPNGVLVYQLTDRAQNPSQQSLASQPQKPNTYDVSLIAADIGGMYDCSVQYPNLIPRDKLAYEQHVAYLANAGLISRRTALEMLQDIADPEIELDRLRAELKDAVLNPEAVAATAQAKQAGQTAKPTPQQGQGAAPVNPGPMAANEQPTVPINAASPVQANNAFLPRNMMTSGGLGMPPQSQMPQTRPGINQGPPMTEAM